MWQVHPTAALHLHLQFEATEDAVTRRPWNDGFD